MTQNIIETVIFKLADGVTREQFLAEAAASTDYIEAQSGFLFRRLSSTKDGTWIEHIEWATLEDAQKAAAGLSKDPSLKAFLSCVNGDGLIMHHSDVEVSVN